MTIKNIEELAAHMERDLNCHFHDAVKAESTNSFYRIIDGKPVDFDVITWICFENDHAVELGGDLRADNTFWFSDQFVYPFDSAVFDSYLSELEQLDEDGFICMNNQ